MAVVTFDTLKFADTLKAGGVPPAQAEAQARAMADVFQVQFKELATKDDIAAVRAYLTHLRDEVKRDLAHLRDEVKRDVADLAVLFSTKLDQQATQLNARIDREVAALRTDIAVLKWMSGATIPLLTAIAIRLFFFKL